MIRPLRARGAWSPRRAATALATRARTGLAVAMGLALVASLAVVALSHGYPATHPQMGTGSIWLPSDATGELTLFDSSTLKAADQVQLATPGSPLLAAQTGNTGYAADQATGRIWRVDGTTLSASRPADNLIPGIGPNRAGLLQIFATPAAFYAVSHQPDLRAVAASPASLTAIGTLQSTTASITAADTTVDQDGRLWLLDQRSGDLSWFTGGKRHVRAGAVAPGTAAVLTATDGQPVIVTPARQTAQLLDPGTGAVQRTISVPGLRPGDAVTAVGSADTQRVVLTIGSRGLAVACSFSAGTCQRPIRLPYRGPAALGQPVETAGNVFIPDDTRGAVIVVSLATGNARLTKPILQPTTQFDLLTKDGIVFYDNPLNSDAGVIDLDGSFSAGSKYNPSTPTTHAPPIPTPGGSAPTSPPRQAPTVTQPSTRPTTTPTGIPVIPIPTVSSPGAFIPPPVIPTSPTPTKTPSVAPTPLVITELAANPSQPLAGQAVTITVSFTGPAPASWTWTVTPGGGRARTTQPVWQTAFNKPGNQTVTVASGTATKSLIVNVIAPNAQCGETITTNLVLNTNLNCSGNGLIIGANDVTLDLGGHTISGPGSGVTGPAGVSVVFHSNMTVKNGTITGFDAGIEARESQLNMSNLDVTGGSVDCWQTTCAITTSRFSGSPIDCAGGADIKITGSTLSQSPVTIQKCLANISGSQLNNAPVAINSTVGDYDISGNTFLNDGIGIKSFVAISEPGGPITSNNFNSDNVAGVFIEGSNPSSPYAISGNTFSGDGASPDGTRDSDGNLVQGGLHIDFASASVTTIQSNHGTNDGGDDIWATPGNVVDGGGNTSDRGAAGCVGVRCS